MAAAIGGVGVQTVRDWVPAFNAAGPAGLLDGKAPGQRPLLNPAQREALRRAVETGRNPAIAGVVRWRLIALAQGVFAEFPIAISKQTLSRMLRAMAPAYAGVSARAIMPRTLPLLRRSKNFAARLEKIAQHDAAGRWRCGFPMKPGSGRTTGSPGPFDRLRRARRGPCPAGCNTAAMSLHLAEIAKTVAPGAPAVLLLDQAGWPLSDKLVVPANLTLLPLPPKCPELNPVENLWQFLRDNWLSNRVFPSSRAILDHCCYAWNRLIAQPWRIMSIALRDWAHRC